MEADKPVSDTPQEISEKPDLLYQATPDLADVEITDSKSLIKTPTERGSNKAITQASLSDLSKKSRVFLELLCNGHSTLEAYDLAGFKGSKHAAYQLRSDLREHLSIMLESYGVSRADVKIELLKLLKLPMAQEEMGVETKLKLLKFMDKLTETERSNKPQITPFLVEINEPTSVTVKG